jgi:hypothetical protein
MNSARGLGLTVVDLSFWGALAAKKPHQTSSANALTNDPKLSGRKRNSIALELCVTSKSMPKCARIDHFSSMSEATTDIQASALVNIDKNLL